MKIHHVFQSPLINCESIAQRSRIQGWFAEDASANEGETYEPVNCLACRQTHLVNRSTGRALAREILSDLNVLAERGTGAID
jgi:hypothetical protein